MTDESQELTFARSRVETLLATLERLATGDTGTSLELSPLHDELDAVAYGINALADELRWLHRRMTRAERLKSAELRRQKEAAERARDAKSIFLRNASHEIRTPIAIILSIAELLAMPELSPHERADLVRKLRANSQAVLSLVGNLLDLSRLEDGRLALTAEPVSPHDLVLEVVESLEPLARRKGLSAHVTTEEALPVISTDQLRLRQILVNVIGNALKFTETGGIQIRLGLDSPNGAELRIDIADTGPGIPPTARRHLFEPFGQADSPVARALGGTGLGLAISRRLAEQLGGALVLLETEPGRGSTFRLTIEARRARPLQPPGRVREASRPASEAGGLASEAGGPASSLTGRPLAGVHVLLAEDNAELQTAIRRLLRTTGASVECAGDGEEAIAMATSRNYDVVLMDLVMPNMGGLEAARTLRQNGCRIPIVAVTGDATSECRRASVEAGCNEILSKPFDTQHLITSISSLVTLYRERAGHGNGHMD